MATNLELAHATASAELSPRLTVAEEVAKFIRTKPLGAVGALIILGMLGVAFSAELLAPYGEWAGLAGLYLMMGFKHGLLPLPEERPVRFPRPAYA